MQQNHQFQSLYGTLVARRPEHHCPLAPRRRGGVWRILQRARATAGGALVRLAKSIAR